MFRFFSEHGIRLFTIGLLLVISSCSTLQNRKNYTSSPSIDLNEPYVKTEISLVDVQIKEEKVMGQSTGRLSMTNTIDDLKKLALGNAILESKCDLIVAPFFIVEINDKDVTVSAYGFPATYKIEQE